ncbi:disulfide bond formation protein C [Noviherbaspirillum aridicola]|uniref:Disulfide bond formation protein C n=2 Tax=Noviherbaspirillum aridicola TaxID=2849687 RepID=A0ABQ4Q4B8_9BURK|nr:disulfide bond formation protein C [Noviherbaspirillum aridicola]
MATTDTNASVWPMVFLSWVIATVSTLGAIFLGEVMGLTPCILCWYQRICMFPLVLILAAGLFPLDVRVVRYAFPLALVGLGIAVFHLLVSEGLVSETLTPCTQGVPCSQQLIEWFGFLTIPMLSVAAFGAITAMLIAIYFKASK